MWDIGARYEQYEDLLDADIDTVVVATPGPMHASQAIQALDADLNVLSEVPAAWSIQECQTLVDAAERSRGIYTLAENMCYFHYLMEWRDRIWAGEIGKITYAEAEYVHDCSVRMAAGNWRKDMPPLYYCTHSLGPVLDILSDRCVQAIGLSTGNQTNPGIEAGGSRGRAVYNGRWGDSQDPVRIFCLSEAGVPLASVLRYGGRNREWQAGRFSQDVQSGGHCHARDPSGCNGPRSGHGCDGWPRKQRIPSGR